MALFEWHTTLQAQDLCSQLRAGITSLGLVIDPLTSNHVQLFASDPVDTPMRHASRVTVLAAWTNQAQGEVKIEVRSQEPMLRKGTRCETTALALQRLFPAQRIA